MTNGDKFFLAMLATLFLAVVCLEKFRLGKRKSTETPRVIPSGNVNAPSYDWPVIGPPNNPRYRSYDFPAERVATFEKADNHAC